MGKMIFLATGKIGEWLSAAAESLMGSILGALRTLSFSITSIVYELMVNLYNLFEKLCNARLLDNSVVESLSQRVGLLLGLVMFFFVIFSFIQMLIDPDKMSDKEIGASAIIKKVLFTIIMLGLSTTIFRVTYALQKEIVDVIPKIFLPGTITTDDGVTANEKFGNILAVNLLQVTYMIDERAYDTGGTIVDDCEFYTNSFYKKIYDDNEYDLGYVCLSQALSHTNDVDDGEESQGVADEYYVINYNWIIAPIVGIVVVYILIMYCFKVGVRMVQLAFLEVISPMAIIAYMSPKKDNVFTKWKDIYIATYIDVFIRIAIINLIVLLICIILPTNTASMFWTTVGHVTSKEKAFLTIVIILSLLTFAKKAPDLIHELLPASKSKLGFGASMKDIVGLGGLEKVAKKSAKAVGLMPLRATANTGKRLISGIDSAMAGKGFKSGWQKHPGQLRSWINKKAETLTPESHKLAQERREASTYFAEKNNLWHAGFKNIDNASKKIKDSQENPIPWYEWFDGKTEKNYLEYYGDADYARSAYELDKEKKNSKKYHSALNALKADPNAEVVYNGQTYSGAEGLQELEGEAQKVDGGLNAAKEHHEKMRAINKNCARKEDEYYAVRYNEVNPANSAETHKTYGEKVYNKSFAIPKKVKVTRKTNN